MDKKEVKSPKEVEVDRVVFGGVDFETPVQPKTETPKKAKTETPKKEE